MKRLISILIAIIILTLVAYWFIILPLEREQSYAEGYKQGYSDALQWANDQIIEQWNSPIDESLNRHEDTKL